MIGKRIRMERIMDRNSGKTVIIPMDHGVTIGPVAGLINMQETINAVAIGGANAIILHKGLVEAGHRRKGKDVGLIVHLSASTQLAPDPSSKTMVCTVEEAIKLGADAVSIHVMEHLPQHRFHVEVAGEAYRHLVQAPEVLLPDAGHEEEIPDDGEDLHRLGIGRPPSLPAPGCRASTGSTRPDA